MGVTLEKMAAQLRRAIQAVLDRGLHDPRVKGMVTVTRVEPSADFTDATVHVTVLPHEQAELTMHGIRSAAAHVRAQVSRRADFRRVPTLHFRLDTVRRREADVLSAIARAVAEDEARAAGASEPVPGTDPPPAGAAPDAAEARATADAAAEGAPDPDVLGVFDAFLDERAGAGDDEDDATTGPTTRGGDPAAGAGDHDPGADETNTTDDARPRPRAEDHAT